MQYAAFCILLLAISEPLLIHAKKVVLVLPRQIRRSPGIPFRPDSVHYRKSSQGNGGYNRHNYQSYQGQYYPKRPTYRNPPFPHGGDDFDQGHDTVNHVQIPYGKDISHALTFGKGYVPYDNIKGSFSFGRERYTGPRYAEIQNHKHPEQEYAQTSFSPSGAEYSTSSHSFDGSQSDSYFSDAEGALDYRERRNDRNKFYASRSIEKDLGLKTHVDLNSAVVREKEQQLVHQNAADFYKQIVPQNHEFNGGVTLPSGIPAATIGGSKEGIVLRDTVSLDDYQRKLQELTKTWPSLLTGGAAGPIAAGFQQQQQHHQVNVSPVLPTAALQGSSFTGSTSWLSEFAQPKQGYAVKEDLMEPQHDFRTMPVQTSIIPNVPVNVAVQSVAQTVHG